MTAYQAPPPTSFEAKVCQLLEDHSISVQELADQVDVPEWELRALRRHNDPHLSELKPLSTTLRVPPATSCSLPASPACAIK